MSLPSPAGRPRIPKPRKTDSAGFSMGHPIRAAVIFAAMTWALCALVERCGVTDPLHRLGLAAVISLVLTPVAILLIDRWWKLGTEQP
jgi:hypothetical protein